VTLLHGGTGAKVAFYVTIGVFVLLEQRIRWRSALNRNGSRSDRGSLAVVIGSIGLGVAGAFLAAGEVPAAAISFARGPLFATGLVLLWAGIVIRQWAVAVLGRYFTVDVRVQSGQTVVDRGPYQWARHPSYAGMIITFAGMGLALGNWLSLAILVVVPTAGLALRIHIEERILLQALGDPYRRFADSRKRLFPGLW
jgi:protein-S-isoprenylcysteine O-methyltransferase Ste14